MSLREHLSGARSMLGPATWLLSGAIGARLAVLAATVLLSQMLTPSAFGRLSLLQTMIALGGGLAGMGLGVGVTQRVAETRDTQAALAGTYIAWTMRVTAQAGTAITVVVVALAGPLASLLVGAGRGDEILASAPAIVCTALLAAQQGALTGLQGFRRASISQAGQGGASSVGLILGAAAGGTTGALAGFSAGMVLATALSTWLLSREAAEARVPLRSRHETFRRRKMWAIGVPAFVAFLALYAALLGGQLLLSRQHGGYAQIALFSLAYRWHLGLLFIPAAIAPAVMPMMTSLRAGGEGRAASRVFMLNLALSLAITSVPAAGLALLAPYVLRFSGAYYAHHAAVLIILAAAAVPGAVNNVLSSAGISLGAVKAWLASDIALAVAFFAAAGALVPTVGALGLAWAYLAGYVVTDAVLIQPVRSRLSQEGSRGREFGRAAT